MDNIIISGIILTNKLNFLLFSYFRNGNFGYFDAKTTDIIQNFVLRTIYFRSLFPEIFLLYYIFYVRTDALYNNFYYFNKESKFFNPYFGNFGHFGAKVRNSIQNTI